MLPDLETRRPVAWHEATALCMADATWADGSDVVASPRQILRRQLERLAQRGWQAQTATELESIVFRFPVMRRTERFEVRLTPGTAQR